MKQSRVRSRTSVTRHESNLSHASGVEPQSRVDMLLSAIIIICYISSDIVWCVLRTDNCDENFEKELNKCVHASLHFCASYSLCL